MGSEKALKSLAIRADSSEPSLLTDATTTEPGAQTGNFCHLLITFANSLGPDQDQRTIGPDLDPNCLTL